MAATPATNAPKSSRHFFAKSKFPVDYPDFLEIQIQSFKDFFQLETTPENRSDEGLFFRF